MALAPSCATKPGAVPAAAPTRADAAYAAGVNAMREGDFERALERFDAAWKEKPAHPGVQYLFGDAVAGLKRSGDEAYQQRRSVEAGRKWTAALHAMDHPAARGRALPFSRADLRGHIDRLTASLLRGAIEDYRRGDLEAAIAGWNGILSYDPANAEAARSSRTAATQLENLRKMTAPK